MQLSFTHIAINTPSFEASISFYRKWCHLTIIADRRIGEFDGSVWLGNEPLNAIPQFVIVLVTDLDSYRVNHLGFQVSDFSDLELIELSAIEEGVIHERIRTSQDIWLGSWMSIIDPGNNIVEFTYAQRIKGIFT